MSITRPGRRLLARASRKQAEAAFQRAYELNPTNTQSLLGMVDVGDSAGAAGKGYGIAAERS